MHRILLIVTVLYVIWRVLNVWGRKIVRGSRGAEDYSRFSARRRAPGRADGSPVSKPGEELVECAGCQTFVPRARMTMGKDGRLYCGHDCVVTDPAAVEHGVRSG